MTHDPSRRDAARLLLGGALAAALPAHAAAGPAAPDFTLRASDGRNLRLAELRGSVVLVNFWATWCAPCRIEMPHLNKLHDKFRDAGLALLGVSVDDDPRNAAGVASKMGLRFPVLFDADKRVVRLYEVATMPTTVFIDRDGRVRSQHRGYRDGDEALHEQRLRALLKE